MKKLTQKQIDLFLKENNAIEGVYDEVSFKQARRAWEYLMSKDILTPGVILKTHKILMLHLKLFPNEKGYFRNCEVRIGNRFGLEAAKVREEIEHWIMNMNDVVENGKKESDIFKEKIIKEHHIKYEEIHPFVDGNGRTGRLFLNWERLKVGMDLLIIKESERSDYYKWFK